MLVDLRPKGVTGVAVEKALGRAHLTCNKNGIPWDPEKPMVTSGIRLGSPAGTTRGFAEAEFAQIGQLIVEVVDGLAANGEDGNGRESQGQGAVRPVPDLRGVLREERGVSDPLPNPPPSEGRGRS